MTALAAFPVQVSLEFDDVPLPRLAATLAALAAVVTDGTVTSSGLGLKVSARIPITATAGPELGVPTLRVVPGPGPAEQINQATAALSSPGGPAAPAESTPAEEPEPDGEKTVCCPDCGRRFSTAHALAVHHGRTHRRNGQKDSAPPESKGLTYRCGDCGREYDSGANYEHHRKLHHTSAPAPVHEVASARRSSL